MNTTRFQWGTIVVVGFLIFFQINVAAEQRPMGNCNTPKPRTDLRHCVFWNKAFSGIDLHGTLLDGVSFFSEANLDQADFTDAVIENMDETWFQHAINLPIHLQQMLSQ
jgi:uncharacterized protein YjbI with pentapeptide repeats